MQIPAGPNLPSLELIANQVRAICNDAFAGSTGVPGEGQIITDQVVSPATSTNVANPLLLSHMNSAIRTLYRKLRLVATPTLIADNYVLFNCPVINGMYGPNVPDPSTQMHLDNVGFWDGQAYTNTLKLPPDMLQPIRLWERTSTTQDTFQSMNESLDGLPPRDQTDRFVQWEWRGDRINFVGCTQNRDLRIRYEAVFPQFFLPSTNFVNTYVPIMDCEDYVAYEAAQKIAFALGAAPASMALEMSAKEHLFDLRNNRVRRMQQNTYRRAGYNDGAAGQELDVYGI
jgi:hypothetical protein